MGVFHVWCLCGEGWAAPGLGSSTPPFRSKSGLRGLAFGKHSPFAARASAFPVTANVVAELGVWEALGREHKELQDPLTITNNSCRHRAGLQGEGSGNRVPRWRESLTCGCWGPLHQCTHAVGHQLPAHTPEACSLELSTGTPIPGSAFREKHACTRDVQARSPTATLPLSTKKGDGVG